MITRRDVLAAGMALPMVSSSGIASAQAAAAPNAWLYSDPRGSAAFRNNGNGHWTEITSTGVHWFFREAGRNGGFIELRDDSRSVGVRLHASYGELSLPPANVWRRWVAGRWVPEDALPPLIDYTIRLAYFIPSDRAPIANYETKIAVLTSFVSEIYDQSLKGREFKVRSLPFHMRAGKPAVALIHSARPAAYYNRAPNYVVNSLDHWRRIVADIPPAVGMPEKHLLLVFSESFDEAPARLEWPGTVARGGRWSASGGIGIFSSWILRDDFCAMSVQEQRRLIFDETRIKGRSAAGNQRPDSPRHYFIEDGFGAVAHELGHALGLPHDKRQDVRNIMGQGFRHIRWNFADPPQPERGGMFSEDNIRTLLSTRYLATDLVTNDVSPPDLRVRIVDAKLDKQPATVTVEVDASDDRGLRSAMFVCIRQDDVVGGRWLSGKRQRFRQELVIDGSKPGEVAIDATVMDVGGNYTMKRATWPG